MQQLSINRLNAIAPYKMWGNDNKLIFNTDFDVKIEIGFDEDNTILSSARSYWFNIVNLNGLPSPHDPKIMPTIWAIIEEFFRVNPDVLLYLCDTADDQQVMRARLFQRWFNLYEGKDRFIIRQVEIPDENVINYVAMIIKRNYPQANEIANEFEQQAELFKNKP